MKRKWWTKEIFRVVLPPFSIRVGAFII